MSNKKYNEFAAGSFDPLRILLTANPATGELKKVDLSNLLGFRYAIGMMSQSGTDAPVVTYAVNTLGFIPTPARDNQGAYYFTDVAKYPIGKTILIMPSNSNPFVNMIVIWGHTTEDTINLYTLDDGFNSQDGLLSNAEFVLIIAL